MITNEWHISGKNHNALLVVTVDYRETKCQLLEFMAMLKRFR